MNDDLIKRYIYSVVSHLPTKMQADVEKDLESMISELLYARCGEAQATEADIRVVLTELGSPEELAVKYSGDENKALISGIYLLWFKKLLKIVLPIAAAGVAFAKLIEAFISIQSSDQSISFVPTLMAEVISGAISAAFQAFVWLIVIFAVLEHKKIDFKNADYLSSLRPVPDKKAQIKIHDPIINIFWNILMVVLLLGFPSILGAYTEETGWVSVFEQGYLQSSWYLIAICAIVGIANEIFKLAERRYSKKLVLATVVSNIIMGISSTIFFADSKIINPDFIKIFSSIFKLNEVDLEIVFSNIHLILIGIVLFALILDTGVTAYRALRYDK